MKIIYFANIRLPTEKAHGLQIMKTCEALAEAGVGVELVVPIRRNHLTSEPFDFYKVKNNFSITKIGCIDGLAWPVFKSFGFWIQTFSFYFRAKKLILPHTTAAVFTRDLVGAWWLAKTGAKVFYELHTIPEKITWLHRAAWSRAAGLVVISNGIKTKLVAEGVSAKKILVARDAIDLTDYGKQLDKKDCRSMLGLPEDLKIIIYTGHLYDWKGADVLAQAAQLISSENQVYLVGGTAQDIARFKKQYTGSNLHIVGWQDHARIPLWHAAADLLVLPNSARLAISRLYTSPMKLFEYLASGTPLIASDLPALREVVSVEEVVFCAPDDPAALARAIEDTLEPAKYSAALASAALAAKSTLAAHTWPMRAGTIKEFILNSL